ncbi:uncharacterized protein LOC133183887 [Saccostrea echinata]|uniref:uncharacterized protein LOC133183887 n=1 Tax=Saccostrea echinata TaxID=191078 RepID=UPI002A7FD5C3|nr:uncharacterized protein LOC133183887 [Saccostrea echinata]
MTFLILFSVFGLLEGATHQGILNLYHQKYNGDGTYYGAGTGGTCSYPPPSMPPVASHLDKLVALNAPQFYGSLSCGMCFRVHGSGHGAGNDPITGTFTTYVKDLCPECHAGSLDLAENGDGRWKIQIQAIQCPVGNTKIEYKFQGSNHYYLKLQIRNARIPATQVEMYQPKSHRWSALRHTTDGFWVFGSDHVDKPVVTPFRVRLTAANGETVVDHIPKLANDAVIHGDGVQFSLDSSLPH